MAGDFIQWTIGLAEKREIALISAILKRDKREIAGRLMTFWEWCDANVPESAIHGETLDAVIEMAPNPDDNRTFIDEKIGVKGAAKALEKAGWLLLKKSTLTIPGFGRHNGSTAKTRARNTKNKRNSRKVTSNTVPEMSSMNGDNFGQKRGRAETENREQRIENREESSSVVVVGSLEGDARGRKTGEAWEIELGCLSKIKAAHLSQVSVLCAFHRAANREHPAVFPANEAGLMRVLTAAARADRRGKKNKSGMFAWLLSNPTRAKFDGDDSDRAANSLRLYRRAMRDDPAEFSGEMIPLCDEVPS